MTFRMPRPMSRRDSRFRQFQQRVPRDLLERAPGHRILVRLPAAVFGHPDIAVTATVGATSLRFSLRTADPSLLKRRQAAALEQVEKLWSALRTGPTTLSRRQRAAFAGLIYAAWRAGLSEDPVLTEAEWKDIAETVRWELEEGGAGAALAIPLEGDQHIRDATRRALDRRFGRMTDLFLARESVVVDAETRTELLYDVARAMMKQAEQAAREASGDYGPDPNAARFPEWQPPQRPERAADAKVITFASLFEAYARLPGKFGVRRDTTIRQFRKTFVEDFAGFVRARAGHQDPARVSVSDVVAWRDQLIASGLNAKTVKDKKVAAVKAIYARAEKDGVLASNPAAKVEVPVGKRTRERESGFTDAEAEAILRAARSFKPGRHAQETVSAIRWVPWVGAFTGARITEITQLRREDVFEGQDGWMIRFTPEAGGIKNGQYRDVPIHPCLVKEGFLDFVRSARPGPLFYRPEKVGSISRSRAEAVSGRVSEWVRDIVPDKRVQPTHGWRHRFKTIARRVDMKDEARDYIQGHTIKGMGAVYGDMAGLAREIAKLPDISFA